MGALWDLFPRFASPEYVHVLLNHWPVEGLAAGVVLLAWALGTGKETRGALLWLLWISGVSLWAFRSGGRGYDRVWAMSDGEAQAWLRVHAERAALLVWVYAVLAGAVLGALISSKRHPARARFFEKGALIIGLGAFLGGAWASHAGGRIRHSEFRDGPPREVSYER